MGGTEGGGTFGASTETETVAATAQTYRLPDKTKMLILRCPSANAGSVYVNLGGLTATTGDLEIRSGEDISIDLSMMLYLKMIEQGSPLSLSDYPQTLSYIGTAADEIKIDVFS